MAQPSPRENRKPPTPPARAAPRGLPSLDQLHTLLEEAIAIPGVSAHEDQIRLWLQSSLPTGTTCEVDALGNLSCVLGPKGPEIVFLAHMDELGLLLSAIHPDGSASFRLVGRLDERLLHGRAYFVHTAQGPVPAVVGVIPPHLWSGVAPALPTVEQMRLDFGTSSAAETTALGVRVLQPVTPVKDYIVLNEHRAAARGLDDRAGCVALLLLLHLLRRARRLPLRVRLLWSVQEEIGLRGASGAAAHLARSAEGIAMVVPVDTFSTPSMVHEVGNLLPLELGGGPVVRAADSSSLADPRLVQWVQALARRKKIPLRVGVTGGGNDGVPFQSSGAPLLPISIPFRYTHSNVECIDLRDLLQQVRLLYAIASDAAQAPVRPS